MLWHAVGVDTRRHDRSGDLDRRRDQSSGRLCLCNFRTGSTAVSMLRLEQRRCWKSSVTSSEFASSHPLVVETLRWLAFIHRRPEQPVYVAVPASAL